MTDDEVNELSKLLDEAAEALRRYAAFISYEKRRRIVRGLQLAKKAVNTVQFWHASHPT